MTAVLQRVRRSCVTVDGIEISSIDKGLNVLLGVEKNDTEADADYLVSKIIHLRIFEDETEKLNLSLEDIKGDLLVISQFTLLANCKKGKRPSFDGAAPPDLAERLYNYFVEKCRKADIHTETGKFGANMSVFIENSGPVTIILNSRGA